MEPTRSRPGMDASYGLSDATEGMLDWDWVRGQLLQARNYWVCTVRENGGPHAAPVWGIWDEDALFFATGKRSLKGRNLARDPRLSLHLESGDEVVIVEGKVVVETNTSRLNRVADAYEQKYEYRPNVPAGEGEVWYRVVNEKALAWLESDFPTTAARFTWEP
jgi:PPOX class probable F420-dependent enzyme